MLDFGTGPGTAIWAVREHFNVDKCTAIDLSEDMLRVAEYLEGKKSIALSLYLKPPNLVA
jgi:ubiquinone/menaquinone biosynthesis C-methylase UbiE